MRAIVTFIVVFVVLLLLFGLAGVTVGPAVRRPRETAVVVFKARAAAE